MDMPKAAWRVVEQMHARFADTLPETEDGARAFTHMVIQQLVFLFPAGGWCWKSSTPNHPPSKDVVARQLEGRLEGWDILIAAGETGPRRLAGYPPEYHDLIAAGPQHPIHVEPFNYLPRPVDEGGVRPPDTPPARDEVDDEVDDAFEALLQVGQDIANTLSDVSLALVKIAEVAERLETKGVTLKIGR